ncbi:MAG TPA: hypothetical protein DCL44_00545 [Elusimicrobia bacterium]|nr:hypothetical protein [Elusimicrobiota bacterium]
MKKIMLAFVLIAMPGTMYAAEFSDLAVKAVSFKESSKFATPIPDGITKKADTGGFMFDDIFYKVTTKDGQAVSGVAISYNLQSSKLTVTNGSSWIPTPSLPHWHSSLDKAGVFGRTGTNGTFGIKNVSIASSPSSKPDSLYIFSNPNATVQCSPTTQAYVSLGSLSVVSKKPDDGNTNLCGFSFKHDSDRYNSLSLHCVTSLTANELKTLIAAKCAGNK